MSMIVVLKADVSREARERICDRIRELGLSPHLSVSNGDFGAVIGAIGEGGAAVQDQLEQLEGVEAVMAILKPYKLASREFHAEDSVFEVRGVRIGGPYVTIIAGPCAIESRELVFEVGRRVRAAGA